MAEDLSLRLTQHSQASSAEATAADSAVPLRGGSGAAGSRKAPAPALETASLEVGWLCLGNQLPSAPFGSLLRPSLEHRTAARRERARGDGSAARDQQLAWAQQLHALAC
jgi:hypothetical protein